MEVHPDSPPYGGARADACRGEARRRDRSKSVVTLTGRGISGVAGDLIRAAVDGYESRQSLEARGVKDADKLDMLLQAVEYRDIGVARMQGWIDSARKGLATKATRRIAEVATEISPLAWRDR